MALLGVGVGQEAFGAVSSFSRNAGAVSLTSFLQTGTLRMTLGEASGMKFGSHDIGSGTIRDVCGLRPVSFQRGQNVVVAMDGRANPARSKNLGAEALSQSTEPAMCGKDDNAEGGSAMGESNVKDTQEYNLGKLSSDVEHLQGDVREIKERLVKVEEKLDRRFDQLDERHRSDLKWIMGGMGALGLLIIGFSSV